MVLTLLAAIGIQCQIYQESVDRMTVFAEDIYALTKQTEDIHDRVVVIEHDWQRVHGPIPAGSDEIAMPTEPDDERYADDERYTGFYGRLYVPDAEIDVALYCGSGQDITDRADSANIFTWGNYSGRIIADHSNQEFAKLFSVEAGMMGYIRLKEGDIINLKCAEVLNGHNTIELLTDEAGVSVMSSADYVMYTCRDGWQNIRICLWDII